MANIRVNSPIPLYDGQPLAFKSPVDISQVSGLIVYYEESGTQKSKVFQFADAHGNNVGHLDLFSANAVVNVILDFGTSLAFVQNADTNTYLEDQFTALRNEIYAVSIPWTYGTSDLVAGESKLPTGHIYLVYQP